MRELGRGARPRGPLRGRRVPQRNPRVRAPAGPGRLAAAWRGLRRVLPATAATAVLVAAGLGALGLWQQLVRAELLRVRHVAVAGATRLTPDATRRLLGPIVGTPMLELDLEALAAQLRESPWIRAAQVTRRLPDTVRVSVQEHAPRLLVSLGELYVADEEGALFKPFAVADGLALPLLTGLGDEAPHSAPSPQLAAQVRRAVALGEAVAAAPALGELQEIHWQDDTGWSIVTGTRHRLGRVHLGAAPQARLALAVQAVRALQERRQVAQVIWADGQKNARRVSVQLEGGDSTVGRRG